MGIIGNTLFIAPFYGGDNEHQVILSNYEKSEFINQGVQLYDSIDYITCQFYNMNVDDYRDWINTIDKANSLKEEVNSLKDDDSLPF